jgi:hypothetical protein
VEIIVGLIALVIGLWLLSVTVQLGLLVLGILLALPRMLWNAITGRPMTSDL